MNSTRRDETCLEEIGILDDCDMKSFGARDNRAKNDRYTRFAAHRYC